MTVRAKFKVDTVAQHAGGLASVKLTPVMSGSEENKRFYKYSPSGSCELQSINLEAMAQFEVGKEYYLDFTPAGDAL